MSQTYTLWIAKCPPRYCWPGKLIIIQFPQKKFSILQKQIAKFWTPHIWWLIYCVYYRCNMTLILLEKLLKGDKEKDWRQGSPPARYTAALMLLARVLLNAFYFLHTQYISLQIQLSHSGTSETTHVTDPWTCWYNAWVQSICEPLDVSKLVEWTVDPKN